MMCLLPGREEELIASATKIASIPLLTSTLLMLLVDSPAVVCSPAALRSGLRDRGLDFLHQFLCENSIQNFKSINSNELQSYSVM